jgi:hypothetical protein
MNKRQHFISLLLTKAMVLIIPCMLLDCLAMAQDGELQISFTHSANGKPIIFRDSIYQNAFGENYNIYKLKYYIGQIKVEGFDKPIGISPYHLINAAGKNEISFKLPTGKYKGISFLLGVDSASNCSGAQSGALDALNDMFWTWNSGYVFFKLEGRSPSSTADLNRIEHHIGGYKPGNNVARTIRLHLDRDSIVEISNQKITRLIVSVNLDRYWDAVNPIHIAETPVCMQPGSLAQKMAANFEALFTLNTAP